MQLNELLIKLSSIGRVTLFQSINKEWVANIELIATIPGLTAEVNGRGKTPIAAAEELDFNLEKVLNLANEMSPGNRFLRIS